MDSNTLKVTFELDELYGWMKVRLSAREQRLEFDASYLCDSVTCLLASMVDLLAGKNATCTVWTTEREVFDFVFVREDERITLRVYTYPEGPVFSREQDGAVVFEVTISRADMVRAFVAPAQKLQTEDYPDRWGHQFPVGALESAMDELENPKRDG